jgi:hypothetical protein
MLLAKSAQPCTLTALSLAAAVLLFACRSEAAVVSFGSGDPWSYTGEVAETPQSGRFCTFIGSHLACAQGHGGLGSDAGEVYEGEFVNGDMEGYGTYDDDFIDYVGNFKHGRFDGTGELTCWRDGKRFKGTFKDGAFISRPDGSFPFRPDPWRTVEPVVLWPEDARLWWQVCR